MRSKRKGKMRGVKTCAKCTVNNKLKGPWPVGRGDGESGWKGRCVGGVWGVGGGGGGGVEGSRTKAQQVCKFVWRSGGAEWVMKEGRGSIADLNLRGGDRRVGGRVLSFYLRPTISTTVLATKAIPTNGEKKRGGVSVNAKRGLIEGNK